MANPLRYYTRADFLAITSETVEDVPDNVLAGFLKRMCRHHTGQDPENLRLLPIMLAEARRRGPSRIWNWWHVQMLNPDRCACGGPGHYIVGRETFCRACRSIGIARLQHVRKTLIEPMRAAWEEINNTTERHQRQADAAKRLNPRRAKRPRV